MKTVEELAEEAINKRWKLSHMPSSREGYVNTLLIRIGGYRDGFMDGYHVAERQQHRDNYNDHKLKEAEETIAKLKERLKLLSVELSHFIGVAGDVQGMMDAWKRDDQVFEFHGKVGPWAGFFPVKKDKK